MNGNIQVRVEGALLHCLLDLFLAFRMTFGHGFSRMLDMPCRICAALVRSCYKMDSYSSSRETPFLPSVRQGSGLVTVKVNVINSLLCSWSH